MMKNNFLKFTNKLFLNSRGFTYLCRPQNLYMNPYISEKRIIENFEDLKIVENDDIQAIELKGRNSRDPKRVIYN